MRDATPPKVRQILVVDDDAVHRTIQRTRLVKHGYEVLEATSGREALAYLLAESGPRLAIVDVMMPDVDGFQVCRRVREADLEAYRYLILVTARDGQDDVVKGLDAGADEYVIKPVGAPELAARIRAGVRILQLEEELREAKEALRREAIMDPLTGLLNRRGLEPLLQQQVVSVVRSKVPVSVLIADVDHFKAVNDTHGHAVGDLVLQETAKRLQAALRREDGLARWGGEEFLALLPRADNPGALVVAERMRAGLSGRPFRIPDGPTLDLTASFGVATVSPRCAATVDGVVDAADQALYTAKRSGRNRSVAVVAIS